MSIEVLLADDHAVLRDGLAFLLGAQSDIKIVGSVANGRAAVREALRLKPQVIVMDILMPELNGIEATRQICAAGTGTRVVILSMQSSSEHVYRALEAGAGGFVLKESAGDELVRAVRAVHAGKRYLSAKVSPLRDIGDDRQASPVESLSRREREILQLTVEGKSSAEIGALLFISPKTVETYRSRMMQKLGLGDLPGLVKFAISHGLTPP